MMTMTYRIKRDRKRAEIAQVAQSFRLFVRAAALLVRSLVKSGSIDLSDGEMKKLAGDIARPFLSLVGRNKKDEK